MTRTARFSALAGALAITFCLGTLGSPIAREAAAQVIWAPGNPQVYYNGYGAGYINPYQNSFGRYGGANLGYPVYGSGPYIYGSPGLYGNSGFGPYGAMPGASYGPNYRGLGYGNGAYYRGYVPGNARIYSPYGYRRY